MSASSPTYSLDVEAFTLSDGTTNLHYEADDDLAVNSKQARGGGSVAGLVFLELGIDGYRTHRARVDVLGGSEDPEAYTYGLDRLAVLNDAIEALTATRDQLAAMRSVQETRQQERNAFELGRDAQRHGLLDK